MLKIPKETNPTAKFIRTGEGILVFVFNLAMLVVPIVTKSLSPNQAVKYAAILNGVAVISRSGLKAAALLPKATGVQAAQINATVTEDSAQVIAGVIKQALQDTAKPPSLGTAGAQVDQDLDAIEKLASDAGNGSKPAERVPEPLAPVEPITPVEPVAPVEPITSAEPVAEPTEPVAPVEPVASEPIAQPPIAGGADAVPPVPLGPPTDVSTLVPDSAEFASVPSDADVAAAEANGSAGSSLSGGR